MGFKYGCQSALWIGRPNQMNELIQLIYPDIRYYYRTDERLGDPVIGIYPVKKYYWLWAFCFDPVILGLSNE